VIWQYVNKTEACVSCCRYFQSPHLYLNGNCAIVTWGHETAIGLCNCLLLQYKCIRLMNDESGLFIFRVKRQNSYFTFYLLSFFISVKTKLPFLLRVWLYDYIIHPIAIYGLSVMLAGMVADVCMKHDTLWTRWLATSGLMINNTQVMSQRRECVTNMIIDLIRTGYWWKNPA